ncbi:MAG TPA: BBP7 family outer membrane beta-barrel protein, partial [Gemmataceae bacterium]|nr:BBP7 family outer membrane beta-barrel protein [Gemmataceae bacterium]
KPASFAGGLFAQPSNSGHVSASTFTAMPILETKVGYQVTQRLRAFVGYDFLYWNGVVRPGNQIDRNINLSQDPILGATKGVQAGPIGPLPRFDRSGFWAQDINFGVDFRF